MSDQTIAMLIDQQRIELALEITLVVAMLAATMLGGIVAIQMLRHRSSHRVAKAFMAVAALTFACGLVRDRVGAVHRIARERALAEYERTFRSDVIGHDNRSSLAAEALPIEDHRETSDRSGTE